MTTDIERDSENKTAPPSAKAKRRWFAFSLRTLLIATALLSCLLGYFGNILLRVRHQRAVITKIEAAGGKVYLDYEYEQQLQPVKTPPGPAVVRWMVGDDAFASPVAVLARSSLKDEDLYLLLELPKLRELILSGKPVTDRGMATVAQLRNMEVLRLYDTSVTSEGLKVLAGLTMLRELHLSNGCNHDELLEGVSNLHNLDSLQLNPSTVTSNGLAHLQSLAKLKRLDIRKAHRLTDDGLRYLKGMNYLESLTLSETSVSGNGLSFLADLPRLTTLWLALNPVTDEGLKYIAKCEEVTDLDLMATAVTDRGVAHLSALQKLRHLSLWHTTITDESFKVFLELKHLERLDVGPIISRKAALEFKRARPTCTVYHIDANGPAKLDP